MPTAYPRSYNIRSSVDIIWQHELSCLTNQLYTTLKKVINAERRMWLWNYNTFHGSLFIFWVLGMLNALYAPTVHLFIISGEGINYNVAWHIYLCIKITFEFLSWVLFPFSRSGQTELRSVTGQWNDKGASPVVPCWALDQHERRGREGRRSNNITSLNREALRVIAQH